MTPTTPNHNQFPLYEHPQEDEFDPHKYTVMANVEGDLFGERQRKEVEWWYFVLKPDTDPHARVALAAYAESIRPHRPNLAIELDQVLSDYR